MELLPLHFNEPETSKVHADAALSPHEPVAVARCVALRPSPRAWRCPAAARANLARIEGTTVRGSGAIHDFEEVRCSNPRKSLRYAGGFRLSKWSRPASRSA